MDEKDIVQKIDERNGRQFGMAFNRAWLRSCYRLSFIWGFVAQLNEEQMDDLERYINMRRDS